MFSVSIVQLWWLFLDNSQFRFFCWVWRLMRKKTLCKVCEHGHCNQRHNMINVRLTSAAASSSLCCTLLLSVGPVMLPCGLSLQCQKLCINPYNRQQRSWYTCVYDVTKKPLTSLWQILSYLDKNLCPMNRPSPPGVLRLLCLVCSPVQCKAISPSAAVSLWAKRSRSDPVLSLFSTSSTRSRPVCLFPSQLFWLARPLWRWAVFGKRRLRTWF